MVRCLYSWKRRFDATEFMMVVLGTGPRNVAFQVPAIFFVSRNSPVEMYCWIPSRFMRRSVTSCRTTSVFIGGRRAGLSQLRFQCTELIAFIREDKV